MHLTCANQSNRTSILHRKGVRCRLVSSLITASMLLASGISIAQESRLSNNERHHGTSFDVDTWIIGIGTLFYRDNDEDGYFSGISLSIDADTDYEQTEIYASIDAQPTFGARERLLTSANFTIYANQLSDEYRIDIDLLTNYQTNNYDLYIKLHDAYDHRVLDSVSAGEFSNLYRLPLESQDRDLPYVNEHEIDPAYHHTPPSAPVDTDVRVVEFAGSSGIFLIMAIMSIVAMRKPGCYRHESR